MKRKRKRHAMGLESFSKLETLCFWVFGEVPQNIFVKMNPRFDPTEFGWGAPTGCELDEELAQEDKQDDASAHRDRSADEAVAHVGASVFPRGPLTLADRAFWVMAACWMANMGCAYGVMCALSHSRGVLYALLDSVAIGTEDLLGICRLFAMWITFFASCFWWYRAPYRSLPRVVITASLAFAVLVLALTGAFAYMEATGM